MTKTIKEWDSLLEAVPKAEVFYELSNIVPPAWTSWFYGRISENAPFSWGDNDRTMVTMERLIEHIERTFDIEEVEEYSVDCEEWESYIEYLNSFTPATLVDLES